MNTPKNNSAPVALQRPEAIQQKVQTALSFGEQSEVKPITALHSLAESSTKAQIIRLIDLLRSGPKDTHYLRKQGISHPAGRVVDSSRTTTVDSDGYPHHGVALYELVTEPER